jgi:hypothetical protein
MKTFEWIISKIHSKLGGYTHWVHLYESSRPLSDVLVINDNYLWTNSS